MRSRAAALIVLALLVPLAPMPAARADAPLEVDAGGSLLVFAGEDIPLRAVARGGAGEVELSYTADVEPGRLTGGAYDTTGLAPQDVVLTVVATDALGAVATDTVRHRVESTPILVARNVTLNAGAPDELAGGANVDARPVFFQVPPGTTRIEAELTWTEPAPGAYDLDLRLLTPGGADATGAAGATQSHPERAAVAQPEPGRWTAKVEPFLNGPTTARLVVTGFPAATFPTVSGGSYVFGSEDAHTLVATSSAPNTTFAWDLDGDALFETPGESVTLALPPGEHQPRVRALDPRGYEVEAAASVSVRDADTVLRLRCGNDPTTTLWAMEFTSTKGSCWIHGGHHTYFMDDERYALRAIRGRAFTVEQQFSPPTETSDEVGKTPLHLEVSEDGQTWTEVAVGLYQFLGTSQRQDVFFDAPGASQPFRFVRLYEPRSAAQGLSGYLDHTEMDVEADRLGPAPAPAVAPGTRALSCATGDILEDFFATHPCWFGGVDRYDAPSFWHTYYLGDGAHVATVAGSFTLLPWRSDDWTQGNSTVNGTGVRAFLQTSTDGVRWTDVAEVPATFGASTPFAVAVDEDARFVRLFPEYHARFDDMAGNAPNHHPKGYFVQSDLVVSGILPG